jgi:hypothetical protein
MNKCGGPVSPMILHQGISCVPFCIPKWDKVRFTIKWQKKIDLNGEKTLKTNKNYKYGKKEDKSSFVRGKN